MSCCKEEHLDDLGECSVCGAMCDTELLELLDNCGEPNNVDVKKQRDRDNYGYLNHHGGYYLWKQQEDEK